MHDICYGTALPPHRRPIPVRWIRGSGGAAKALTPAVSPRPQEDHPPPLESANQHGEVFRIGVWTGASTAPELDGALAKVGGIEPVLFALSSPIWLDSEEYTVSPRRS